MKVLGNLIWWLFGGLLSAAEYLLAGLVLCITIIGIPWGLQCFKMAQVMLFPFNAEVSDNEGGALSCVGNVIWFILAGLWIALTHALFGLLLFITIIGIPFAQQHFKFARIAITPFGREAQLSF